MKVKFLALAGAAVAMATVSAAPAEAGCRSHSRSCSHHAKAHHVAKHHHTRKVLVQPRRTKTVHQPAVYSRAMKRVMVSPGKKLVHTEPAKYRNTVKRVTRKQPRYKCKVHARGHRYDRRSRRGHHDHAKYSHAKTAWCGGGYVTEWVKTKELVRGPSKWVEFVRPTYKYVMVKKMVRPARVHTVHEKARYAHRPVMRRAAPTATHGYVKRTRRHSVSERWAKRRTAYKARRAARHTARKARYAKRMAAYKARRAHYAKRAR